MTKEVVSLIVVNCPETIHHIESRESFATYEGLNEFRNKNERYQITAINSAGITSVRVVEGGQDYKVGDRVSFANASSGGLECHKVDSLSGQVIESITFAESKISNVEFSYTGSTVTGVTTEAHGLLNNQTVVISGISSDSFKSLKEVSKSVFLV